MSKIEKALRKAREQMALGDTAVGPTRAAVGQPEMVVVPAEVSSSREISPIAAIAQMRQPRALSQDERLSRKIIVPDVADSPAVKALREIRTRITQRVPERNTVVMVTGLHRGSGISFVAVNLATAIVLDEARTALLVDCNLRDPSLHSLLPDQRPVGLTDYLLGGEDDVSDIIHPTGVERVRVIPAGSRINPAVEYFSMEKMRRLVRSISERYADRHIILDCPPLARTADTQLLMELCDYVLLVLPHGGVTEMELQSALKLIESRKLLGIIVNNVPTLPPVDWKASLRSLLGELIPWRKRRSRDEKDETQE